MKRESLCLAVVWSLEELARPKTHVFHHFDQRNLFAVELDLSRSFLAMILAEQVNLRTVSCSHREKMSLFGHPDLAVANQSRLLVGEVQLDSHRRSLHPNRLHHNPRVELEPIFSFSSD